MKNEDRIPKHYFIITMFYTNGNFSKLPKEFLVFWTTWTIADVFFLVFGFIYKDIDVCCIPTLILDLAYWLRLVGLIGFLCNVATVTVEINESHFAKPSAIIVRTVASLLCIAWFSLGLYIFLVLNPDCRTNSVLYAVSITGLVSILLKAICVQITHNYQLFSSVMRQTDGPFIV
jgi:hypothetical protein